MLKNLVKDLKPSSTLAINETSKKLEQQGKKIFKFGFGQSPFKVPEDVVDNLKWNGESKKNSFEIWDYLSEFKIENSDKPSKITCNKNINSLDPGPIITLCDL